MDLSLTAKTIITPTVASYNFRISRYNCTKTVLQLNRVLHSMQQGNFRAHTKFHQCHNCDPQSNYILYPRISYTHSGNLEKLHYTVSMLDSDDGVYLLILLKKFSRTNCTIRVFQLFGARVMYIKHILKV